MLYNRTFWRGFPDTWEEWMPIVVAITTAIALHQIINFLFNRTTRRHNLQRQSYTLIKHILYALIYTAATAVVVYNIKPLQQMALSLLAGAGFLAILLGIAAQQAFANIVSGIFIIIFRPFKVGDMIEISDSLIGLVEDITLRHTVIRNFEHRRIVVPNSVMGSEIIVNSDIRDFRIRKHFNINIDYVSDFEKAMRILEEEATRHPLCRDNRNRQEIESGEPIVPVKFIGFNNYAINIRAWIWTNNADDAFEIACSLNTIIKKRFDEEGIQLALPRQIVSIYPPPESK